MAKDDITSTEKLLDVIRGGKSDTEPLKEPAPKPIKGDRFKRGPRGTVLGVDLGFDELRLVRMTKRRQMLDAKIEPYREGMHRTSAEFPQFLKTTLSKFFRAGRSMEIWASVPSGGMELRYLRIPKVPRKQIANAVLFTFRKENSFNERDFVFDFDILGEIIEEGAKKIEVLAYIIPKADVEEVNELFMKAGYTLAGVTTIPFAVQNLFRANWLEGHEGDVCNLYIGRNWSRIDLFSNGTIMMSRGIKAGMLSMVDSLGEQLNDRVADLSSDGIFAEFDFEEGDVFESSTLEDAGAPTLPKEDSDMGAEVFRLLIEGGEFPVELGSGVSVREHEVFDMVLPALDRLIRQLERTLDHYYQKLRGDRVARIYISGLVSGYRRLSSYIGQQMGTPVEVMEPMDEGGGWSMENIDNFTIRERAALTPAIGFSLSDNTYTPNAVFTYRDKEKISGAKRIHQSLVLVFCAIMVVLGGYYHFQDLKLKNKISTASILNIQVQKFSPRVDQDLILAAMAKVKKNEIATAGYGDRYRPLAVIGELSDMTPPKVRLIEIEADMGPVRDHEKEKEEAQKAKAEPDKDKKPVILSKLKVEGVVRGPRNQVESTLAQYLLRLQVSPLFGQPNVVEKKFMTIAEEEVLYFRAEVQVI